MAFKMRTRLDFSDVERAEKRFTSRLHTTTAQALNSFRRKFRTMTVKELTPASMVIRGREGTPRQTIYKRFDLSNSGTARRTSLESVCIMRIEVMPMRNFKFEIVGGRRIPIIPSNAVVVAGAPDYVNLGGAAYPIADKSMSRIDSEWPGEMRKRISRETLRVFG